MRPRSRLAALAALCAVLLASAARAQNRAVKVKAAPGTPAAPRLVDLLQASLTVSGAQASLVAVAPLGLVAPGMDPAKAAAFLSRAQAVGAGNMAARAQAAAPAAPGSVLLLPASTLGAARSAAAPVQTRERVAVLEAVSAALKNVSLADISRMPAEEVERSARAIMDSVAGGRSAAAAAALPDVAPIAGSALVRPVYRLARPSLNIVQRAAVPPSPLEVKTVELSRERPQPKAGPDLVLEKLARVAPSERARLGRFLGQAYDLLSGKGGSAVGKGASPVPAVSCVQCEPADLTPSPAAQPEDIESRRLSDEIRRLLNDADGPDGFNSFLMDFALDLYIDLQAAGKLETGARRVKLRDPRVNYPLLEGWNGIATEEVLVRDLPVVSEAELDAAIERRARGYGLNLELLLADGPVKPRGHYSRIVQRLYLAERLSRPASNALGADMLQPFLRSASGFAGDPIARAQAAEHAGRRSPQNLDHVSNLLRLLFEVD